MSIGSVSSYGFDLSRLRRLDPAAATAMSEEQIARIRKRLAGDTARLELPADDGKVDAAKAAAAEAEARSRSQETLYQAQALGQGIGTDGDDGAEALDAEPSAKDTFLAYMKKSPAERMAEDILRSMGLTKEDLDAMPPEERAKVEAMIKEKVDAAMQEGIEKQQKEEAAAA